MQTVAATAILGLDGFVLLAVSEYAGELEQAVETAAVEAFCDGCGAQARLHDRRPAWVRDLPSGGRAVTLVWIKRIWRCVEPPCPVATWTETAAAIRPRASLTERARAEACRRVGQDGHSVAQVAADLGVGWATVMAAVREYGRPLIDDPARLADVTAVGVDETAFLAANATHHTLFVTGIVDVRPAGGGPPRLLDVVPGRCGTALSGWVMAQPNEWRADIEVAALDPFPSSPAGAGPPQSRHRPEKVTAVRTGTASTWPATDRSTACCTSSTSPRPARTSRPRAT